MKIVQLLAHSIEEYDQLKLLTSLGHEVFSPGAYINPRQPMDDKRPALDIDPIPELRLAVDMLGQPDHPRHGRCDGREAHRDNLTAAKLDFPDEMIEWMDVMVIHHLEHTWLVPQWDRVRDKRVIWRTVGQSADRNETMMAPLRKDGLQIVRYSPKERNIPGFAGEDTLIRFYKDPAEWSGWTGEGGFVGNVTQHLLYRSLADDGKLQPPGKQWTSYSFWEAATRGLPAKPAGPGSEQHGGVGSLTYDEMRQYLRDCRVYVYTGTQPASYTLGLVEAAMTGTPTFSILPEWFRILPYGHLMFEGHELATGTGNESLAREFASLCLERGALAQELSEHTRQRAIETFGMETIAPQWAEFLGGRSLLARAWDDYKSRALAIEVPA